MSEAMESTVPAAPAAPSAPAAPAAGLRVIGAGHGRTGTSSLKTALNMLGLKCYHMEDIYRRGIAEAVKWNPLIDAKLRLILEARGDELVPIAASTWEDIFSGYSAAVDFPSALFVPELAAAYPAAKVVLTVRDPHAWYRSCRATIISMHFERPLYRAFLFNSQFDPMSRWSVEYSNGKMFQCDLAESGYELSAIYDEELMVKHFVARNERIKASVPPDNLLVFDVREGWEPLCRSLGCATPSEPFPQRNDTVAFNFFYRTLSYIKAALFLFLTLALPVAVAATVARSVG